MFVKEPVAWYSSNTLQVANSWDEHEKKMTFVGVTVTYIEAGW